MSFVHIPIRSNVNWPWEMMNEAESVATKIKWLPAKEKKRAQQYRNQFLFIVLPASFQFVSRQLFFGFLLLLLFVCVLIFNRNVNALDCVCRRFMSNNELIELVHIYTHRRVCSNDLFYIFILFHFCHTHTTLPKKYHHRIWHVLLYRVLMFASIVFCWFILGPLFSVAFVVIFLGGRNTKDMIYGLRLSLSYTYPFRFWYKNGMLSFGFWWCRRWEKKHTHTAIEAENETSTQMFIYLEMKITRQIVSLVFFLQLLKCRLSLRWPHNF